jgi:hypothetical protein
MNAASRRVAYRAVLLSSPAALSGLRDVEQLPGLRRELAQQATSA